MIPTDIDFYKEILDKMSDGVYFVDRERRILYWNQGAQRLTGYSAEEMVGRHCQDDILCHADYQGRVLCNNDCPLVATISNARGYEARVFLRHKEGRRVPVLVRAQPLRDASGEVVGGIEIFSDDTAQSEAQRKIEDLKRLAFFDHVTQLPNRRFLEMSLQTAISEFHMHKDPFGVLSIDLDQFKTINDSYGHETGDMVLKEVARTLASALRSSDIVGRWGGDEFLAIVRNADREQLNALARRCVALIALSSVPLPDGSKLMPSASLGATLATADDEGADILKRADESMYLSKAAGRNRATLA